MPRLGAFAAVVLVAFSAGWTAQGPAHSVASPLPDVSYHSDVRSPLVSAIVAELATRRGDEKDPAMRNWISEIEGYYRVLGTKPLWVSDNGFTEHGRALADEISKAYTYGLDNAQFQLRK